MLHELSQVAATKMNADSSRPRQMQFALPTNTAPVQRSHLIFIVTIECTNKKSKQARSACCVVAMRSVGHWPSWYVHGMQAWHYFCSSSCTKVIRMPCGRSCAVSAALRDWHSTSSRRGVFREADHLRSGRHLCACTFAFARV